MRGREEGSERERVCYTNHSSQGEHTLYNLGRVGAGLVRVPHDNTHKVVEEEVGSAWGEHREHL